MKLPTPLELKRSGFVDLKKSLDPSALERGLQYMRDGGLVSIQLEPQGKTLFLKAHVSEPHIPQIEISSPSQPLYSTCDCSLARHGIFCKHQALLAWVLAAVSSKNYDLPRLDSSISEQLKSFEPVISHIFKKPEAVVTPTVSVGAPLATPTLKAMVLVMDALQDSQSKIESLPRVIAPTSQFSLKPQITSATRFDDIHFSFVSPALSQLSPQLWTESEKSSALKNLIWYVFEDNTWVRYSDIAYHPYSAGIDSRLVLRNETDSDPSTSHELPLFDHSATGAKNWDLKRATTQLIVEMGLHLRRSKLSVYVVNPQVFQDTSLGSITATPVEWISPKVQVRPTDPFPFEIGTEEIRVREHGASSDLISKHAVGKITQNRLEFRPEALWLQRYPSPWVAPDHNNWTQALDFLQKQLGLTLPATKHDDQEFSLTLDVIRGKGFTVALTSESHPEKKFYGLPGPIQTLIQCFIQGIKASDPEASEKFFDPKKTSKRGIDLKLLRHSGFAQWVFLEVLRNAYASEDRISPDEFKKRLTLFLNRMEGTPAGNSLALEVFCSKSLLDMILVWVRQIEDLHFESSLWLNLPQDDSAKPLVWIPRGNRRYLKILWSWVAYIAQSTKQAVFFKSSSDWLSVPNHFELIPLVMKWSEKPVQDTDWIEAFGPLTSESIELCLNGSPIETLNPEDFKSEFELTEPTLGTAPLQDGTQDRIDWFELHPKYFFKGVEITEAEAQDLGRTGFITFQGKVYRLGDQRMPSLDQLAKFWDQLAQAQSPQKKSSGKLDRIYRLPRHATLDLLVLRAQGVNIKGGVWWTEVCAFYDQLGKPRDPLILPKTFSGELKPYQEAGVRWMHDLYHLGMGGILADDMGLGKTVQTLAFFDVLRAENKLHHALIAVPTSLTFNWISEAKRFTPDLAVHLFNSRDLDGAKKFLQKNPQALVITTYGLLAEHEGFFASHRWNIHIYDEAQNLKNITAKRTTASRKIPARFKLCLTGTPLENHMGEFFSLMDLVVPGALGGFDTFRRSFMQSYAPPPERIEGLKQKTRPLLLRRTKSSILKELPQKTESTLRIPFEPAQAKIYREIALSWNKKVRETVQIEGEGKSQLIMLTALLRLRQACSSPASIPNVEYKDSPPKISLLVENLKSIIESGESALVFTQFIGTFDLIAQALKKENIPFFELHGKVSRKDREDRLRSFQEMSAGAVMLMTLKTGGVGLNLTKASYVFHIEPWWNPAVENQATDRTHRIGQTKPVQVYRYIMSESVEEKIELLKTRKSAQFDALFSDTESVGPANKDAAPEQMGGSLTQKDFEMLLGIQ